MGTARTYVWLDEVGLVVAYYSLVPHTVRRDELPARVGHGPPEVVPSILLARLAQARSLHGQGIGSALLVDALTMALGAIAQVGGRLIVVDAIDERAAAFYEHHGFTHTPVPGRHVMKASDAATTVGVPF